TDVLSWILAEDVFGSCLTENVANLSIAQGLEALGGDDIDGAQEILIRAAAAAILNTLHPDVDYPYSSVACIRDFVDEALCGDREAILEAAAILESYNDLGACPLD
ncbi:MAG: hypothetical protein ACOCVR_03505, partial [Myxococcota bacterium]